jgi:SWI/SNF-related matrix-associated actin-dependent regulator of chromatin subfamily A-like protein 1
MIADESHYLKNRTAKRTKVLIPLIRSAKRTLLITGTPALACPQELFPQMQAAGCDIFSSFTKFAARYCNPFQSPYGLDTTGSANLPELHAFLVHSAMIRRKKDDVLGEGMAEKKRLHQYLTLSPEATERYKEECRDIEQGRKVGGNSDESDMSIIAVQGGDQSRRSLVNQMWGATGRSKVSAVAEYVLSLLKGESAANASLDTQFNDDVEEEVLTPEAQPHARKIIVFAHHQVTVL